jgi:uncharacterized protein involved in exopolysaccharide biosynthesis
LLQAVESQASAEAELVQLKKLLAAVPETGVTSRTTGVTSEGTENMRAQLYTLQLKELDLLTRLPEQHPEVLLVRKQVSAARDLLAREESSREQVTTGPNRVHEEARLALLRQEPAVAALRSRAESLRSQLDHERLALRKLNENALRVAGSQRAFDLQSTLHRRYAENLAQAQVDRALETEKISNISIVQRATFDAEPVKPRRALNVAIGFVLALCGSLGLAALSESWGQSTGESSRLAPLPDHPPPHPPPSPSPVTAGGHV